MKAREYVILLVSVRIHKKCKTNSDMLVLLSRGREASWMKQWLGFHQLVFNVNFRFAH